MLLRSKSVFNDESKSKEEDKELESWDAKSKREIHSLKSEIEQLKSIINQKEKDSQESQKYAELLSELYEKGIIDTEGKFIDSEI